MPENTEKTADEFIESIKKAWADPTHRLSAKYWEPVMATLKLILDNSRNTHKFVHFYNLFSYKVEADKLLETITMAKETCLDQIDSLRMDKKIFERSNKIHGTNIRMIRKLLESFESIKENLLPFGIDHLEFVDIDGNRVAPQYLIDVFESQITYSTAKLKDSGDFDKGQHTRHSTLLRGLTRLVRNIGCEPEHASEIAWLVHCYESDIPFKQHTSKDEKWKYIRQIWRRENAKFTKEPKPKSKK